jgi:hypothetical protein
MGHVGWRARISFLLAGAIFVFCHMLMSGNRGNVVASNLSEAGYRSVQDGGLRNGDISASRIETDGRKSRAD